MNRPLPRRALAALLAGILLMAAALSGCSKKIGVVGYHKGDMLTLAWLAQEDMYMHFWDDQNNHIVKTDQGYAIPDSQRQTIIWDQAMMAFEMYTLWQATDDQTIKDRLTAQWAFVKGNFTQAQLIGNFSNPPNIAVDDAGWDAMALVLYYQASGDTYALQVVKALIQNAYDYYKDGDTANGLWYPQYPPSSASGASKTDNRFKSLYDVGLVAAALEFQLITGDQDLFADTLNVYNWMETNLCRDAVKTYPDGRSGGGDFTVNTVDYLYWCDFNVGRTGRQEATGPDGGLRPTDIREANSVSSLMGNMAMGVIQARLYRITGDQKYLDLALRTVNAINNEKSPYYNNGVYYNDRDAWTNAAFMGPWVSEVLALPGIQTRDTDHILRTAQSIGLNCRTADGYWRAEWAGGNAWEALWAKTGASNPFPGHYTQIMTSANTVGTLTAAALLEKQLYPK
ncbi:MAG: hypothetical protein FWF49_02750 [Oscillospiraceae bacterium]|nr:hypothetical protein [Oscillospiraceae bacterium]